MTRWLGHYNTATTRTHVRFPFTTHDAAGANVAPSTALEAADIRIYRAADGAAYSATQRSSANGVTVTSPFDTLVGVHDVDIDLTDNTDAGFYAAGYRYAVMLSPDETVDGQTLTGVVLGEFEIGPLPANMTHVAGTAQTAGDLAALLATIAAYIDTEVAAIKAKTDNLPSDPADQSLIVAATDALAALIGTPAGASLAADVAAVKADAAATLADTGTDGVALASATLNAIADALLDRANAIETGLTLRQAQRLIAAALAGVLSGAATTTVEIKGAGVATVRIQATVDADGNRSALTLTV